MKAQRGIKVSLFQKYFDFCDWWHNEERIAKTTAIQWSAIVIVIILVFVIEWDNAVAFSREIEIREMKMSESEGTLELVERSLSFPAVNGHTSEGETTTALSGVTEMNVTRIRFRLQWNDDIGTNDRFSLRVEGPKGQSDSGEDASGNIVIELEISDMDSATGASDNGTGEWQVTISAVDCPGRLPRLPDRDSGNDWTLSTELYYYEEVQG